MSKPHGRDCPDRCSQCAGITPKRVTLTLDGVTVDGVIKRAVAPDRVSAGYRKSARRGGLATARRTRNV